MTPNKWHDPLLNSYKAQRQAYILRSNNENSARHTNSQISSVVKAFSTRLLQSIDKLSQLRPKDSKQ